MVPAVTKNKSLKIAHMIFKILPLLNKNNDCQCVFLQEATLPRVIILLSRACLLQ